MFQRNPAILPNPTKFPANSMRKEVMEAALTKNSTMHPYRFANTSGSVKALFAWIWRARNNPLITKLSANPTGTTTPSQKENRYDRSTFPNKAFESNDCDAKVMATIVKGRFLQTTKKLVAVAEMKYGVAKPTKTKATRANVSTSPKPEEGGSTGSGQAKPQMSHIQHES